MTVSYNCSFVVGLSEDLRSECFICLNVLRDPYMVGCCGYRFCRTCIAPIQKKAQKCPLCKSSFTSLPDRQLERILNKKMVHCSNKAYNGCECEIPLGSLEEHLKDMSNPVQLLPEPVPFHAGGVEAALRGVSQVPSALSKCLWS